MCATNVICQIIYKHNMMEKAAFKGIFHHLRNRPEVYCTKYVLKKFAKFRVLSKVSD